MVGPCFSNSVRYLFLNRTQTKLIYSAFKILASNIKNLLEVLLNMDSHQCQIIHQRLQLGVWDCMRDESFTWVTFKSGHYSHVGWDLEGHSRLMANWHHVVSKEPRYNLQVVSFTIQVRNQDVKQFNRRLQACSSP